MVGEDVFHLSQNAGEDVVADVGGDDRDRAVGHGGRLGPVPDVGAAALPALNQPLRDQQGQGLPHGLAADLKLLAQELFGGQKHAFGRLRPEYRSGASPPPSDIWVPWDKSLQSWLSVKSSIAYLPALFNTIFRFVWRENAGPGASGLRTGRGLPRRPSHFLLNFCAICQMCRRIIRRNFEVVHFYKEFLTNY